MDADLEPVVKLELSLFEAWAVYTFLLQNETEVALTVRNQALAGQEVAGYRQPLRTTQRALAKVKAALDETFLETKRRWPRTPEPDDMREDDE
jgi:hypothetical protein